MKFHPIADIFPNMSKSEFRELKEDIQKNGLIEPIWTHQDKIIDGRNRYNACMELGIQPRFKKWTQNNGTSLVDFVWLFSKEWTHRTAKLYEATGGVPPWEKNT